jgi:hypothetical protein
MTTTRDSLRDVVGPTTRTFSWQDVISSGMSGLLPDFESAEGLVAQVFDACGEAQLEALHALLAAVVTSLDRVPHPAEDRSDSDWRRVGVRVGRRWSDTLFAGARRRGRHEIGLWAYEGETRWFGDGRRSAERPATTPGGLVKLISRYRRAWWDEDAT